MDFQITSRRIFHASRINADMCFPTCVRSIMDFQVAPRRIFHASKMTACVWLLTCVRGAFMVLQTAQLRIVSHASMNTAGVWFITVMCSLMGFLVALCDNLLRTSWVPAGV